MANRVAIELKGITKTFGDVIANDNVDLTVYKGEILSILGENGCGKTTLMNMIAGIYYPDKGQICIDGKEVQIRSPKDALDNRIGMVHQHFKLVDIFTATENIILGLDKKHSARLQFAKDKVKAKKRSNGNISFSKKCFKAINSAVYKLKNIGLKDIQVASKRIEALCNRYGFELDPNKKIYEMSVSEKQTVEIIKVLYRGADVLILDEPTAVLTPQETQKLFDVLRNMRKKGKSIIIITHKLHEVMALSDRVAVLCKGKYVGSVMTAQTNENMLTEMMVGQKVSLNIYRGDPVDPQERLVVNNINCVNRDGVKVLDNVSFTAYSGEILGIAGIAGSGQRELLESIAGLQKLNSGTIMYHDPNTGAVDNLRDKTPIQIRNLGVRLSFVPEDRLGMGLVGSMDIVDNMMLRTYGRGGPFFLHRRQPKHLADDIIKKLSVVTPSSSTPVRRLSGGNVQKVLVGREIAASPTVLMVAYPLRGLDINSSHMIYDLLNQQKEKGVAVIFVGEDLDVLIEICDRIMVIGSGRITGIVDGRTAEKQQLGMLMTASPEHSDING